MASFTWDSPLYTHGTNAATISLIQDFNDKLIQAGLIDYTSGNTNAISGINLTAGAIISAGGALTICTLNFRLPVGNGVIQYDNALSTVDYKVISQASYDSTVVNLRFVFQFHNFSSSGGRAWDGTEGIVLRCLLYISFGTSPITHDLVCYFGLNAGTTSTTAGSHMNFIQKITNYISLTRNHLYIQWGSINKNDEATAANGGWYSRKRHTILLSLYRNAGKVQMMYPNSVSSSLTATTAAHYIDTGITTISSYGMSSYNNFNDMPWKFNAPSSVNGNIIIQPTLINIPDHFVNDPGVWCTRINDSQEVTSSSEFVVMYGGQPTKLNYMILSGQQPWFKPYKTSKEYSYAFLFDNYTCTTTSL